MDQSNTQQVASPPAPQVPATPNPEPVVETTTPKSSSGLKRILIKILLVIVFMGILALIGTVFCKGNLRGIVSN